MRLNKIIAASVTATLAIIAIAYLVNRSAVARGPVRQPPREFELTALAPARNRVGYPYVWMPIDTPQYRLTDAIERIRLLNNQYNHLLLAKKRISELIKWGMQTDVLQSVPIGDNPEETAKNLRNWWTQDALSRQTSELSPYRTWEASLARYLIHYEMYLAYGEEEPLNAALIEKKLSTSKELREDEGILTRHIARLHNLRSDKEYVERITSDVFDHLYEVVGTRRAAGNTELYAYYSLQSIAEQKGYGTYTAYFKTNQLPPAEQAVLRIGLSKNMRAQSRLRRLNEEFYIAESIQIVPEDNFAVVSVPRQPPLEPQPVAEDETGTVYRYALSVPETEGRLDYLFVIEYDNATASALFEVRKKSTIIDNVKNKLLHREIVPVRRAYKPAPAPQRFEEIIYTGTYELVRSFTVTVTLSEPDEGDTISISLMPIYEPELTLIRKDATAAGGLKDTRPAAASNPLSLWPYAVSILAAIVVLAKRKQVASAAIRMNKRLAAYYLVIALIFMVVDVVLIQSFNEIYLFALLFWVLFMLSAPLKPAINIKIGALLFVIAVFFKFTSSALIVEKLARWVILFLVWGSVYLFLRSRGKKTKETSLRNYLAASNLPLAKYLAVTPRIKWLRTRRAALIGSALVVIVVTAYIANGRFAGTDAKPLIDKFEPSLVYQSNTIVLNGRGFGENKDKRSHIMTDFGPVAFESWTDSKITFIVPDTLPNESVNIWIESPSLLSNKVPVRIISSTNGWDEQDDEYFNQLEHLSDETLRLNKYR